ncbi:MAG TPA: alanine--tRNA ligase [Planctomycetaceae bacterium]|jgi:alanyl-tRNA synthetase|nr:alanine--tRNA ligase [Planctomycetaceae bacterium]
MKTDELRESYLSFFASKGCVRKPSDVLVPRDDPTVLFTPAGMNQFKAQFLGIGKLEFTRATTCQKCLRTGDIQNVGVTAYHHTFFEMLGNFSFGDYFKREAIHWAWEYLTDKKWLGLDSERLSVTVYLDDDEAFDIWTKEIGLPHSRVRREDEHENFWPAGAPSQGPDGVCGPCSEIYYQTPGSSKSVEIWNLVFTQFNRVGPPPNNLRPLPKKNIDTGMGLERTASVLQGVPSNFEIDILRPLCLAAADAVGVKYEFEGPQGRPLRRVADHVRAVTFCIHEGVSPGSEKESYVVRQLLRRALLEGYLLGKHEPFLHTLVPTVVEMMKVPYPDLAQTAKSVGNVIEEEESQFLGVVEKGLSKFDRCVEKARASGSGKISGDDAFDLHQTDGFLIELTEAMAAKKNLAVDLERFKSLMNQHKIGSGSGAFLDSVMAEGPLDAVRKSVGSTQFVGYDALEADGEVVGIIAEKQLVDQLEEVGRAAPVAVILDSTPFYGEAGGQVGDTGSLTCDGSEFEVIDTQRDGGLILHVGHLRRGRLQVGQKLHARVDVERRAAIRRAHSATHLLHFALRKNLGETATQRGSKVEQDQFRFDFAHKRALAPDEILKIEDEINAQIAEGAPVQTQLMKLDEAKKAGAMALFGEKYPDPVRVVSMGQFSVELCGGTHLANTGQVGFLKIVSEEPVAKGVRRVVAMTGPRALQRVRDTENLLKELVLLLKTPQPEDLPRRVAVLQDELREAKKQLEAQTSQSVAGIAEELFEQAEEVGGVKIIARDTEVTNRETLREFIDRLRGKGRSVAILLGSKSDGKVALTAAVSKDLISRGVSASDAVRAAAKVVGGGGGGRPDLAEAGGKHPEKLADAIAEGAAYYRSKLAG